MMNFRLCLILLLSLFFVGVAESFELMEQPSGKYILPQLDLDRTQQIDPAYVRAITDVANYHGANVSKEQVEQILREKMDSELVRRLGNIALLICRGSIDSRINQPVPIVIEFKDEQAEEEILRGLARQQAYEMRNGLGGLRLGTAIAERNITAMAIGGLGIANLIILLTREDTAFSVVKITFDRNSF